MGKHVSPLGPLGVVAAATATVVLAGGLRAGAINDANDAHERRAALARSSISAIGDSIMVGAAPALEDRFENIVVDAKVGRQMTMLDDRIDQMRNSGELGRTVVIGLGTNGPFDRSYLEDQIKSLGDRTIVLVNTSVPRSWESSVNRTLAGVADEYDNVALADWHAVVEDDPGLLGSDGTHPAGSEAGREYAKLVDGALGNVRH